jgi:hypothetical protein
MPLVLLAVLAAVLTAYLALRYWRAVIWSATETKLSNEVCNLLDQRDADVDEYGWTCSLLKPCPPLERSLPRLPVTLRLYYKFLKLLHAPACFLWPPLCEWLHRERAACSHFAASVLDQRIAGTQRFCNQHPITGE